MLEYVKSSTLQHPVLLQLLQPNLSLTIKIERVGIVADSRKRLLVFWLSVVFACDVLVLETRPGRLPALRRRAPAEALWLTWENVDLSAATALIRKTKYSSPVTVHLTPFAISSLANLPSRKGEIFPLTKSGRLYTLFAETETKAGLNLPPRTAFHVLRHPHATWRRRYVGADTSALVEPVYEFACGRGALSAFRSNGRVPQSRLDPRPADPCKV